MKKFKVQLTGFDIGLIIAFVVVGLLGGGAWYYLSGALQDAQNQDKQAAGDYTTYSSKGGVIVSQGNAKTLQDNSNLLKDQINPEISTYLLAKDNLLQSIKGEDPIAWKHDLDEDVHGLITAAKGKSVTLPGNNFYFGFKRYLTESPGDEATTVLSKQRTGIKAIAQILINSQVKGISKVRRTYEEDPHAANAAITGSERTDEDQLAGYAVTVTGNYYTAYPFEVDFDTTAEALRPVIDALIKSPYLFIVRTVEVHNDKLTSPVTTDLDKMAQVTSAVSSVVDTAPGAVAAAAPAIGPQYLFGNSILHVKMRIDMIEWNPKLTDVDAKVPPPPASTTKTPGHP